jgi:tetratricopeptide (TPR) repeat protein
MIVCPACQAENPAGTKICVKCGTPLPQAVAVPASETTAAEAAPATAGQKSFGVKDMVRDLIDFCWLLLIIFLIFLGFLGEVTHWTFRFTQTEQAKMHVKPALVHPRLTSTEGRKPLEYGNPSSFYRKGKRQFDSHHYQSSFNYLRQALQIDPTYAQAYFGLGFLYARFEMNDASIRMYEMALRFDPSHIEAMNNLAMMYFHSGNYDDALELIQKSIAMNDSADGEYNLGSIYLERNQPWEAIEAFKKAVAMRPNDPSIFNNMALTYEKLGKKKEAEETWNKVLKYSDNADLLQQAKTHIDFLESQPES